MTKSTKQIAIAEAQRASGCAAARLWGMKYRASIDPPSAAIGGFPYLARTCAEWEELPGGAIVERQMTDLERKRDAKRGSRMLRDAILRCAA